MSENIALNETENQKLFILLKGGFKFRFIKQNQKVKTLKQLNFFLKNKNTINDNQKKVVEAFENDFSMSIENEIINNIKNGIALNDEQAQIVASLIPSLDKIKLKEPAPKNYELKDGEPLQILLKHYQSIIENENEITSYESLWFSNIVYGWPVNFNGRKYNGQNVAMLAEVQKSQGLSVPVWLTEKNIKKDLGVEHLTVNHRAVVSYKTIAFSHITDKNASLIFQDQYDLLSKDEQSNYKKIFIRAFHKVWHPDDVVDLLDAPNLEKLKASSHYFALAERLKNDVDFSKRYYDEQADQVINALYDYAAKMGIEIKSHNSSCHFSPSENTVYMVDRERFKSDVNFAGVLAHELIHSTGVDLERKSLKNYSKDISYRGYEEVIAESGSNNILLRYNLPSTLDNNSAAYIVGWFKAFKGSKQKKYAYFESAVSDGNKAADFIFERISQAYKPKMVDELIDEHGKSYELYEIEKVEKVLELVKNLQNFRSAVSESRYNDAERLKKTIDRQYTSIQDDFSSYSKKHFGDETSIRELRSLVDVEFKSAEETVKNHQINKELTNERKNKLKLTR